MFPSTKFFFYTLFAAPIPMSQSGNDENRPKLTAEPSVNYILPSPTSPKTATTPGDPDPVRNNALTYYCQGRHSSAEPVSPSVPVFCRKIRQVQRSDPVAQRPQKSVECQSTRPEFHGRGRSLALSPFGIQRHGPMFQINLRHSHRRCATVAVGGTPTVHHQSTAQTEGMNSR